MADRLMDAVIAAGLCDPGANGPRSRLVRLPCAVNGKHAPPFPCRLIEWLPDLRYSIDELVDGFELEIARAGRPRGQVSRPARQRPADGDPVWIARPEENAVLAALRARGLYKTPLGDGKHDITCPWVSDHTGKVDGGTAYFEPDDGRSLGGFNCFHGHCADRHIRDLLQFVDVEANAARMKPTIRVLAGEIHQVVDAAERELAQSQRYYQRGGLIVTVATDPGTRETRVQEISQPELVRVLAGVATWEKFDRRTGDWMRTDPPARHVTVLFDSTSYNHLPVLSDLARQPYLRPDGSLAVSAGYDDATGMFGVFDACDFAVPECPSRADAESALITLNELLTEFGFATDIDRSATLCALLTAAIRPSLPRAPMFHMRAHMAASGKSYLCELITAFATPQPAAPMTFPGDDEECRKLLLAELLRAPAAVQFDNLTGNLVARNSLCTALTSQHISGRILGMSKTAIVSTRVLFLSSGTNVGPVQDMTRRCITVHLDPGCEVPAEHRFERPELVHEVLTERGRFVSAALTIVRAWIAAGRPTSECKPFAGFAEWSELCRQPLLWLGMADPIHSVFEAMAEDPDRETLARFLEVWEAAFGNRSAMVREAVKQASICQDEHADLREVLHDIADERGEINRRKLGRWIRRHEGRVVDGRRLVRAGGNRSAEAWRVESISSVSTGAGVKGGSDTIDNAYARASRGA